MEIIATVPMMATQIFLLAFFCGTVHYHGHRLVLKARAVNSVLGDRNMIGKIPTWWENSVRGNRKTVGKNTAMVGEKKSSVAWIYIYGYIRGFTYPFSLSVDNLYHSVQAVNKSIRTAKVKKNEYF